jgi:hypothetical protein
MFNFKISKKNSKNKLMKNFLFEKSKNLCKFLRKFELIKKIVIIKWKTNHFKNFK